MLTENVIKLFDILGYIISIDNENRISLIDKNTNMLVNVANEEGRYFAKSDNDYITFAFNYPIATKNSEINNYLDQFTIKKIENDDLLRVGCSENQLLIVNNYSKKDSFNTKPTSYSFLIRSDGSLSINLMDNGYIVWKRNEILTNVPDEVILDIFDDERLLAIIQYYTTIYPKMMESVIELIQCIVSRSLQTPFTRKLNI